MAQIDVDKEEVARILLNAADLIDQGWTQVVGARQAPFERGFVGRMRQRWLSIVNPEHYLARPPSSYVTHATSPDAVRWSAHGALERATHGTMTREESMVMAAAQAVRPVHPHVAKLRAAWHALALQVAGREPRDFAHSYAIIGLWNDSEERQADEVASAMRLAAASLVDSDIGRTDA